METQLTGTQDRRGPVGFRDVRALKVSLDLLDQLDCKVHLEFLDFLVE